MTNQQDITSAQVDKFDTNQGFPKLGSYSAEIENLNRRTETFNDPDKITYVYMISYGQVVDYSVAKGKVSFLSSYRTNQEQIGRYCFPKTDADGDNKDDVHPEEPGSYQCAIVAVQSPQLDGSYGGNGDGIFWFDDKGAYQEWKGEYRLSDGPLNITSKPLLQASPG